MTKSLKVSVATAVLSMLVGSAVAWACTAQYSIYPLPLQAGAPGSQLVVNGQADANRPVEVRWDSPEGPVLGTGVAAGQDGEFQFAVPVTIPDASPGVHYLMVMAKRDAGVHPWEIDAQGRWVSRAAFNVTTPASPSQSTYEPTRVKAESADLWQGFEPGAHLGDSAAADAGANTGGNKQTTLGVSLVALGFIGVSLALGFGLGGRSRRGRASNIGV